MEKRSIRIIEQISCRMARIVNTCVSKLEIIQMTAIKILISNVLFSYPGNFWLLP